MPSATTLAPHRPPRRALACLVTLVLAAGCSTTSRGAAPEHAGAGAAGAATATTRATAPAPAGTLPATEPPTTVAPLPAGASRFVSVASTRVYDSRTLAVPAAIRPGQPVTVQLAGHGLVPLEGVSAVAVNVTAIGAAGPGHLTIWADEDPRPVAAAVELAGAGDTVAKLVTVRVGPSTRVKLASTTAVDVALDVSGWFEQAPDTGASDGRFVPIAPARVVDTDTSTGAPGALPAGGLVSVPVAGAGTAVPADATAVALQVSAFDSTPPGFVTVWSEGSAQPETSDLNLPPAGWTATNVVLVRPGTGGRVRVQTSAASGLAIDVVGWFTGPSAGVTRDGLFVPVTPTRLLDTTAPAGGGPLDPRFRRDVLLGPVTSASVAAAFLDVTAVEPDDTGTINVYPAGTPRAAAIALPVQGAAVTSNATALVRTGASNAVSLFTEQHTSLTVDLFGYVLGATTATDPLVPPVAPGPDGTPALAVLDQAVGDFVRNHGATGASVAIAKDGRVVVARAYGSTGGVDGSPTRVDSLFRYASMSKPITAAAVLQLVQAGGLSLDTPALPLLAKRVPLPPNADPRLDQITIRQLLQHVSGLTERTDPFFNDQPGVREAFGPTGPATCEQAARWFVGFRMQADPGTRFAYVNMNYCLLSLVIEVVTKLPYDQAVQQLVLSRRGIHDAALGRSQEPLPREVVHLTQPADQPGGGLFMESLLGAGGWVGTSVDLVRFLDGLDPRKPGAHLIQPDLYSQLLVPATGNGSSWGLGVEVFGADTFGHTGSLAGARGMEQHRADGITWAILVNGSFANHGAQLQSLMNGVISQITSWPSYDYGPDLP